MFIEYQPQTPTESPLIKTALVIQGEDGTEKAWQDGSEEVLCESAPCGEVEVLELGCDVPYDKMSENGFLFTPFCTFLVVGGNGCSTHSNLQRPVRARALDKLLTKERMAIEATVWGTQNAPYDIDCALTSNPTELAQGSAMVPIDGLTALEEKLLACTDTPFIHVPQTVINFLLPYLHTDENGCFRTALGSFVIPGAGYDGSGSGGAEAAQGNAFIYGTGQVRLLRGEVFYSDGGTDFLDFNQNNVTVHAERAWGFWHDPCCGVFNVQVKYCHP